MLKGNRPIPNDKYWEWRLTDRFRAVDDVETELSRLYATAYETIWKDYDSLTKGFLRPDGTLDYSKFEMATKFDAKLNRKTARYYAFLNRLDDVVNDIGNGEILSIEKLLMDMYKTNYYETLYHLEDGLGYQTQFALLTPDRLKQVVHTKWSPDGKEFSDRIWGEKRKLNQQLRILIQDGLSTGKSPQHTAQLLHNEMGGKLYASKRIVRTESMSMITESDNDAYSELGFTEYKILSTFDKRTSPICQRMDGRTFPVRELKIGTNAPPFHPNCRSTTEPVMAETAATRFARDINGNRIRIPTDMTFEEFKRDHLIPN